MLTSIFKPDLQSYPKKLRTGLNFETPRGIFRSEAQNLYWVCDDPEWRFAIVLRHERLPCYSHFRLGEQPIEQGIAHGLREIRLIHADESTSTFDRLGTLRVTWNSVGRLDSRRLRKKRSPVWRL